MKKQKQTFGHIISVRLQEDQAGRLKQMQEQGISISQVIRKALESHFETLREGGYLYG